MNDTNAGADEDQPGPQPGSMLRSCPPLQSFLKLRSQAQLGMEDCSAASFYFGVLNLAPKLALKKIALAGCTSGGLRLQAHDGTVRLLPTGNRREYWDALHCLLAARVTVLQVPEWAAAALRPHYKVEVQQTEYLVANDRLLSMPGGRLARMRSYMHAAARKVMVMPMANPEPYLELNALWYAQNRARKFRTYDKTSIDWLLTNWHELRRSCPDILCLGARDAKTNRLLGFAMGSALTKDTWTCYTRRFDRRANTNGPHMLAYQSLGARFVGQEFENDGTGGDRTLRQDKERLASATIAFYKVTP